MGERGRGKYFFPEVGGFIIIPPPIISCIALVFFGNLTDYLWSEIALLFETRLQSSKEERESLLQLLSFIPSRSCQQLRNHVFTTAFLYIDLLKVLDLFKACKKEKKIIIFKKRKSTLFFPFLKKK